MKHIKTLLAIASVAAATQVGAVQITINSGVAPQPDNSGDGTIEAWLAAGVTSYNTANDPDLPAPGDQIFRVNQDDAAPTGFPTFGDDVLSITIPTGEYNYVAFHWGGSGGGTYQSFYIGDIGGAVPATINFPAPGRNGLSWYALFDPTDDGGGPIEGSVPDAGATALMLGLGTMGLAFFRARK
jgi:hypothetical protein